MESPSGKGQAGGGEGGQGGGGVAGGKAAAKALEPMDEFTKRSFTATQKILREQRFVHRALSPVPAPLHHCCQPPPTGSTVSCCCLPREPGGEVAPNQDGKACVQGEGEKIRELRGRGGGREGGQGSEGLEDLRRVVISLRRGDGAGKTGLLRVGDLFVFFPCCDKMPEAPCDGHALDCRSLLVKARGENQELRARIAELSTAGFDEDDFNIGSLPAVARLAEEAETFSARIEAEKRKITDSDKKLRDVEKAIKDKKDFLAQYATDANLAKQVCDTARFACARTDDHLCTAPKTCHALWASSSVALTS